MDVKELSNSIKVSIGAIVAGVAGVYLATATYFNIKHSNEILHDYNRTTNERIDKKTKRNADQMDEEIKNLEEELKLYMEANYERKRD